MRRPLSTPTKLNVAALVAAAAGILVQIASGSQAYPTIPPGVIILLVGAAKAGIFAGSVLFIVSLVVALVSGAVANRPGARHGG